MLIFWGWKLGAASAIFIHEIATSVIDDAKSKHTMENSTFCDENTSKPSRKKASTLVVERDDIIDYIQNNLERYGFLQALTEMEDDILPNYSKLYQNKKRRDNKSIEEKTRRKKKVKTEERTLPQGVLGLEIDSDVCTQKVLGQLVSDNCTTGATEIIEDEEEYD